MYPVQNLIEVKQVFLLLIGLVLVFSSRLSAVD